VVVPRNSSRVLRRAWLFVKLIVLTPVPRSVLPGVVRLPLIGLYDRYAGVWPACTDASHFEVMIVS